MSSLPRCRRVKRPTILATRSHLAKKNLYKKRCYKPLYEKLKANNNALAKALSNEKQEYQYLFTKNLALTSEVQELGVACNKRDDIISGVLHNAKETLQLLITLSNHVTNTIASCQQVIPMPRVEPRKSLSMCERKESTRRSSIKSPARGVVQPMVSGHMITKPTINLSRLNIQREHTVRTPPNLSDIDEVLTTPEQSPTTATSVVPFCMPMTRPLKLGTRRIARLPERLPTSMRMSDEDERRSSGRTNRKSRRHSARRSRQSSERRSASVVVPQQNNQSMTEVQNDECRRSPRVALHDVSRLLQNSQSVNIRTLLENSSDLELSQTQKHEETNGREHVSSPELDEFINGTISEKLPSNAETETTLDTSETKTTKTQNGTTHYDEDDPLEGPSWLLNDLDVASSTEEDLTTTIGDRSPKYNGKDSERTNNRSSVSHKEKLRMIDEEIRIASARLKQQKSPRANKRSDNRDVNNRNDDDGGGDDSDDDDYDEAGNNNKDEHAINFATPWANDRSEYYRNVNNDAPEQTETNFLRFVTSKRGSTAEDTDDFTLMWRAAPAKNYNFDINELQLPTLESPIVSVPEIRVPEPEETTNVQRITTHNYGTNVAPACPRVNDDDSFYDHTGLVLPLLQENVDSHHTTDVFEQDQKTDNFYSPVRKRRRKCLININLIDSTSESDVPPTPKHKGLKKKLKVGRPKKDPSSAKVVLKKLNDERVKKGALSLESLPSEEFDDIRQNHLRSLHPEPLSDSEVSSNASFNNYKPELPQRPRRQKAPKNLQEPNLSKKLRRN